MSKDSLLFFTIIISKWKNLYHKNKFVSFNINLPPTKFLDITKLLLLSLLVCQQS